MIRQLLLTSLLFNLSGCFSDPNERTFNQNVSKAFEACNPTDIAYLAKKHNVQTAFTNCGSNNFHSFAWSPDGTRLYFHLEFSGHIMNADSEKKEVITVPTESPRGTSAWITATRLAMPIGVAKDGVNERIVIYDYAQNTLLTREVPLLTQITGLQRGDTTSDLLFTAFSGEMPGIYHLNVDSSEVSLAFPWLKTGFETMTYAPPNLDRAVGQVLIGQNNTVTAYLKTGEVQGQWSPARRGSLHPSGDWLALEHDGDEVSPFFQTDWDDDVGRVRDRRRDARQHERWENDLPKHLQKKVRPRTLSFVNLKTQDRWALSSVYGFQFQWYEAAPNFGSFMLWGFEGKQVNRNIGLSNMADRLHAIETGVPLHGMSRIGPAPTPPKKTPPTQAPRLDLTSGEAAP